MFEHSLRDREARTSNIEHREEQLSQKEREHKREEDRYYQEIAETTSRHLREIREMENIAKDQLSAVTTFQSALESTRVELTSKCNESDALRRLLREREESVAILRKDLEDLLEGKEKAMAEGARLRTELVELRYFHST